MIAFSFHLIQYFKGITGVYNIWQLKNTPDTYIRLLREKGRIKTTKNMVQLTWFGTCTYLWNWTSCSCAPRPLLLFAYINHQTVKLFSSSHLHDYNRVMTFVHRTEILLMFFLIRLINNTYQICPNNNIHYISWNHTSRSLFTILYAEKVHTWL